MAASKTEKQLTAARRRLGHLRKRREAIAVEREELTREGGVAAAGAIEEGMSVSEAARRLGVIRQTVYRQVEAARKEGRSGGERTLEEIAKRRKALERDGRQVSEAIGAAALAGTEAGMTMVEAAKLAGVTRAWAIGLTREARLREAQAA